MRQWSHGYLKDGADAKRHVDEESAMWTLHDRGGYVFDGDAPAKRERFQVVRPTYRIEIEPDGTEKRTRVTGWAVYL